MKPHRLILAAMVCLGSGTAQAGIITDEILTFNASGKFSNGDALGGSVTIDITTGQVTSAAFTATGPSPQFFNSNVGQAINTPVAGDSEIVAYSPTNGGSPTLVLTIPTSNFLGYLGGSIGSNTMSAKGYTSVYFFNDGSQVTLVSGSLTLATPNNIVTFAANGKFSNGETLGGSVIIDTTTGNVIGANLTASGSSPQLFNTNIGQAINTPVAGDSEIVAYSPTNGGSPTLVLTIPTSNFLGYLGGSIGSNTMSAKGYTSVYFFNDGSQVTLASGSLTAIPEPSSLICSASAMAMASLFYVGRRKSPARRHAV